MRKAQEKPPDEADFKYEGQPLPPNLLDYRHMDLNMIRWADTGRLGCIGTFTMALTLFLITLLIIWGYSLLVHG